MPRTLIPSSRLPINCKATLGPLPSVVGLETGDLETRVRSHLAEKARHGSSVYMSFHQRLCTCSYRASEEKPRTLLIVARKSRTHIVLLNRRLPRPRHHQYRNRNPRPPSSGRHMMPRTVRSTTSESNAPRLQGSFHTGQQNQSRAPHEGFECRIVAQIVARDM